MSHALFDTPQRPPQAGVGRSRERCIGSGMPGDVWEHGHTIVPGTAEDMFRVDRQFAKSYLRNRCRRCESTRYTHTRQNCKAKAAATHREHRQKLVDKGFASDVSQAASLMDGYGVTRDFIAAILRDAFGMDCPGLCCDASFDGASGRIVIVRSRISRLADLEFDWRDPRAMLTPQNCGPLCSTCNRQKGDTPWPKFIAMQNAVLLNLQQAEPGKPPPIQLTLEVFA